MNTQPIQCPNCGNLNLPTLDKCARCGFVLRLKKNPLSPKAFILIVIAVAAIPAFCCLLGRDKNDNSNVNKNNVAANSVQNTNASASSVNSSALVSPILSATPSPAVKLSSKSAANVTNNVKTSSGNTALSKKSSR